MEVEIVVMKQPEELPVVEGYEPQKKTISILWANVLAIVLFVVFGMLGVVALFLLWGGENVRFNSTLMFWFLLCFLIGIVIHELIHGLTWIGLTRKGFRHLKFGMMTGAVYCHIDVPMKKRHYVIGALMPLILLGIVPTIIGICVGSLLWTLVGVALISGAAGDIMIVWAIRKEPADALVYDHPSEAGCLVYHKTSEQ